eukprot:TRINITY_DN3207_c0_g1_i6.p3 TRINITY_DN3207_c0_g1~~TRINITY_DN3207_c0_g1_i6.p3  ORF type:complete len:110 (+),score=38.48 TRINITY_DN3207_c0_g1_i6:166-495(+)
MQRGLVGSEMCIRDRYQRRVHGEEKKAIYKVTEHYATKTAEEAAVARKTPLCSGAKSMLVKDNSKSAVKDLYYLAVLSASRRFLWPPLRKLIGAKNIRFATREEAIFRA